MRISPTDAVQEPAPTGVNNAPAAQRSQGRLLFDSFWRALAYLVMPRVVGLSVLPLLLAGGLTVVLGYFYWETAVAGVRALIESWLLIEALLKWLETNLGVGFRAVVAPMIVVALAVPVVVVVSLLLVAALMTPALVSLVGERRFRELERRRGGGFWQSMVWGLLWTAAALLALLLTAPLWLIPPLVMLVPPLIWGWLTTQVMGFEVLAEHASADERRAVLRAHRWPMLLIGITTGYLGAAPSLIWAVSATALIFAPLLIAVSIWLYTLVFAFSALWFVHYGLAALQAHRLTVGGTMPIPTLTQRSPLDTP